MYAKLRRIGHETWRILGIGLAEYEATALTINDDTILPKWSHLCWPNDEGSDRENLIRATLCGFSIGWVGVHLGRPWLARYLRARRVRRVPTNT